MTRYCVIGAGAAGLAAIHSLAQAGHDVVCFEAEERVGGHWHTDYDALHLITSSRISGFPDFPMPADYPLFPSRAQVAAYYEAFADEFDLRRFIRFGTRVVSVTPEPAASAGANGWRVQTDSGIDDVFDGVLIANGHLRKQRIPALPGTFAGKQIHSGSYRNAQDIVGTRVLVVGSGNSGCDLAADAAQARLDVTVAIRRGHYFQPKTFFGRPRMELAFLQQLTAEEQDVLSRLLIRMSVGTHEDYPGLPAPSHERLSDNAPVVNNLLLYWMQHGRIKPAPGLTRLDGRFVHFTDGSSSEFDTILWATGFDVSLPFLDDSLLAWQNGVPLRLAAGTIPVGLDKLFLIGLTSPRGAQAPAYAEQMHLVLKMIAAHESSPGGHAPIAARLGDEQSPEDRIDLPPGPWRSELVHSHDVVETCMSSPVVRAR